jgi:hypothetical protein
VKLVGRLHSLALSRKRRGVNAATALGRSSRFAAGVGYSEVRAKTCDGGGDDDGDDASGSGDDDGGGTPAPRSR